MTIKFSTCLSSKLELWWNFLVKLNQLLVLNCLNEAAYPPTGVDIPCQVAKDLDQIQLNISVGDRMFLGMQDFDFCPNLIKFTQI